MYPLKTNLINCLTFKNAFNTFLQKLLDCERIEKDNGIRN